jgi:hypothetical protein
MYQADTTSSRHAHRAQRVLNSAKIGKNAKCNPATDTVGSKNPKSPTQDDERRGWKRPGKLERIRNPEKTKFNILLLRTLDEAP